MLLAADSGGRREVLSEMLRAHHHAVQLVPSWSAFLAAEARLALTVAPDIEGLTLTTVPPIAVISEAQLFGPRARQERRRKRARDPEAILRDLRSSIRGAGRARGIRRRPLPRADDDGVGGSRRNSCCSSTQDGDKLYVPVQSCISSPATAAPRPRTRRCTGSARTSGRRPGARPPNRCAIPPPNCSTCTRSARRAQGTRRATSSTTGLRQRVSVRGNRGPARRDRRVLAGHGRRGRWTAIVCGDVGFGKTEVAMRAAFVAVQAGKQVAVLVPTTLLARAAPTGRSATASPIGRCASRAVALPQRARKSARRSKGSSEGTVDIVIGTHRLLHADVAFKASGSDHRRGAPLRRARQGALKALRAEVTCSRSPRRRSRARSTWRSAGCAICRSSPRRPPRLAIKTFVSEWQRRRCARRYCARSAAAGRCTSCTTRSRPSKDRASELQEAVARGSVRVGHGQMRERDLEQLMVDFYHRALQRAGVHDHHRERHRRPTANTIMINRADQLGLAQLHQLRGRVGRSHHRAYAYLIAPPRKALSQQARASGSKPSSRWRNSARASSSRRTTWRSAAPANCSARGRAARSPRSASRCTSTCSSARCRR